MRVLALAGSLAAVMATATASGADGWAGYSHVHCATWPAHCGWISSGGGLSYGWIQYITG